MRSKIAAIFGSMFTCACLASPNAANALCSLPNQLTNGRTADATQVMDNFNGVINCLYAAPSGPANALQLNAGGGSFGAVGPLTNGQLVIGSTGGAPQAQNLTPGPGIAITNGPGNITISATGGGGNGLYSQIMSPTPTSASTGLTNWLNQGSAVLNESAVGISINAPSSTGDNVIGRYVPAPTPPYKITALVAGTRTSSAYSGVGIGWFDGSNKLHVMSYALHNGGIPIFQVIKWNSVNSWNANDYQSADQAFSQPVWMQIQDDGVNVSFAFSQDGVNFLTLFSTAKSSGFLGAGGYSNLVFCVNPPGGRTIGTLMSWSQN